MADDRIAAALKRMETVLARRPEIGLHEDAPATARWEGGTRVVSTHANGTCVSTDMPAELGGGGHQVTPGWLFRAGLASCLTTRIAMAAAEEGIELTTLEIEARSRSDTRGLLGMSGNHGDIVCAGPSDMQLIVRIAASGVPADRLRGLVEYSHGRAPVGAAVREAVPVSLRIEVDAG